MSSVALLVALVAIRALEVQPGRAPTPVVTSPVLVSGSNPDQVEEVWGWFEPFAERERLVVVRIATLSPGGGPLGGDLWTHSSIRRLPGGSWCWLSSFWLPAVPCAGPEA